MIRIDKKFVWRALLILLIAATLFFIWSNSMANATVSTGRSDYVIEKVKPIVDPLNKINPNIFETIIRKTAHFSEFALLGGEIFLFLVTFSSFKKGRFSALPVSLGCCFTTAVIDELIQLTSEGRACRFTDMLIDTAGAFTGIIFICLIRYATKKIYLKKSAQINDKV